MRRWGVVLASLAAFAFAVAPAQAAGTDANSAAAASALRGITQAQAAGRVLAADAARYRAAVRQALALVGSLPPARARVLASVLRQVASFAPAYSGPRALLLFSMLEENENVLRTTPLPTKATDVQDADGVVYRWFPGLGFQFHPLADFGALNARLASGDNAGAARLARALVARGVPDGQALLFEYEFAFDGGRPPWTSGMAQAVAAQALARASVAAGDIALVQAAHQAYQAIPGRLVRDLESGPGGRWIRLYSFSKVVVLNAQLQTAVSLRDYATLAQDQGAAALADSLTAAAKAIFARFDTGFWSNYSLAGDEATLDYESFVTQLLAKLAPQTGDPFWSSAAARFQGYLVQPPAFQLGPPPAPLAQAAKPGSAGVSVWLSKRSSVTVDTPGGRRTVTLPGGWSTVQVPVPTASPAVVPVVLTATDPAGNRAQLQPLPLVVLPRGAAAPPAVRSKAVAAAPASPALLLGAGADPTVPPASLASTGVQAMKLTLAWPQGAQAADPEALLPYQAAAQAAAAAGLWLVLDLIPSSATAAPADDASRAAFAAWAASVAQALPGLRYVVVGDEPNQPASWSPVSPAAYTALLASVYDALKAVDPQLAVIGGALSGSAADGNGASSAATFIKAMGTAYRQSRRSTPIMDELSFHPTSVDAPTYTALVAALKKAFDGTAQPGSALPVVYDGIAVDAAVPAEKSALYTTPQPPPPAPPGDEAAQAVAYRQALTIAFCQPTVAGFLLRRAVDSPELGSGQSGLLYPDLSAKASLRPFRDAAAAARHGSLAVCPGTQPPVAPYGVQLPAQPTAAANTLWGIQAACVRDCYFLATLVDLSGKPFLAAQGLLVAGVPHSIALPAQTVPPGSYRYELRLVARYNPGAQLTVKGDPFTVS